MAFASGPVPSAPKRIRRRRGRALCLQADRKDSNDVPTVAVVGGGAAGFYLAREAACSGARVVVLEGGRRVLRKVRASGGGRCNITSGLHTDDYTTFALHYARGARAMPGVLARHSARDVMRFFEDCTPPVPLKIEDTGKVFPVSDTAADVVGALVQAARARGVAVHTRCKVHDVRQLAAGGFEVTGDFDTLSADAVALTTGDAPLPLRWAERLGHTIVPQVPSLFSFVVRDKLLEGLQGVAVTDASVLLKFPVTKGRSRKLNFDAQRGPVLVTHWGLSGPAVLALSSYGARALHAADYRAKVVVNWAAGSTRGDKEELLRTLKRRAAAKAVWSQSPLQDLPRRLWRAVASAAGAHDGMRWADVSNAVLNAMVRMLHECELEVDGKGEFKDEFVTAGGVALKDIHLDTFMSKKVEGLYFAGEVLDVDGRTGGYNLEFAWSSGFIAGNAIAERLRDKVVQHAT